MTRAELIEKLAKTFPYQNPVTVDNAVREIFEIMIETLSAGDRIEIRGFGSFEVKSINGVEEESFLDSDSYVLSFTMSVGNEINKDVVYKDVFRIIQSIWKTLKNISDVRGKAEKNVLLKISPQRIDGADRIPSPIIFKPLIDFYKENGSYFCDVNIATFFNKDVIKCVTGNVQTQYYKEKLSDLNNFIGANLYNYLNNITECKIDRQSVNIGLL